MKTTLVAPSTRLAVTGSSGPLSGAIIPPAPGKFYVYLTALTPALPLYALLDCKANKCRPISEIGALGQQVHMHFGFGPRPRVTSLNAAKTQGLLGSAQLPPFDEVCIAPISMTSDEFYGLCVQKDPATLAAICTEACARGEQFADLEQGTVYAVMTGGRTYGLFHVTELTAESAVLEACHVVLPA